MGAVEALERLEAECARRDAELTLPESVFARFEDFPAEARDFVRTIIAFHMERRTMKSSDVMHDLRALAERLEATPLRPARKAAPKARA